MWKREWQWQDPRRSGLDMKDGLKPQTEKGNQRRKEKAAPPQLCSQRDGCQACLLPAQPEEGKGNLVSRYSQLSISAGSTSVN